MKIKVVGIGDTGCRIVNKMILEQLPNVEFIAINSEDQAQRFNELIVRIPIGWEDGIEELFQDADMALIMAGMGDCTTLAAELVAEIVRGSGILTIAMVTTPFSFEGANCSKVVEKRIKRLLHEVDSLFVIHNDRLIDMNKQKVSADTAFWLSDEVLRQAVRTIIEAVTAHGRIQLDFVDVKAVMKNAGHAWMSVGMGTGDNRASDAAKKALANPLLGVSIHSTKAALFKIVGGADLTLYDVNQGAEVIKQAVDPEANIIFGVDRDPAMENKVRITLIGTGG